MNPDLSWQEFGSCKQFDPDLFFVEGTHRRKWEAKIIRAACDRCPVRRRCLEYALSHPDPQYGVWGGLTEWEVGKARSDRGQRYGTAYRPPKGSPDEKAA